MINHQGACAPINDLGTTLSLGKATFALPKTWKDVSLITALSSTLAITIMVLEESLPGVVMGNYTDATPVVSVVASSPTFIKPKVLFK